MTYQQAKEILVDRLYNTFIGKGGITRLRAYARDLTWYSWQIGEHNPEQALLAWMQSGRTVNVPDTFLSKLLFFVAKIN